jgi:hypothetical protein
MNINALLSRLSHFPIPRLAIVTLIALVCNIPSFCGEIHYTAEVGDLTKVKALLKDNPELVSSKGDVGETPLHVAAKYCGKDMVELLLANKADVNAKSEFDWTPLHAANEECRFHWLQSGFVLNTGAGLFPNRRCVDPLLRRLWIGIMIHI